MANLYRMNNNHQIYDLFINDSNKKTIKEKKEKKADKKRT